jgi:aminoglycoside phosphotransferase (APT) family kinase protein
LATRLPDAERVEVSELASPKSGFSALTLVAPVRVTRRGQTRDEKVVLRVESPDPAIYPAQAPGLDVEVAIQYRVMEALAATGVAPLASLIGYEPDTRVLGAPFFAMGFVDGEVTIENPPYTQEGFFVEASPERRCEMIEAGLRILARIHALDWQQAGFDWLVPPHTQPGLEAQLALWEQFGKRELRERVHPVFDAGVAYLHEHLPRGLENRFSWGDSRLGNIIFRDGQCAAITDFENSAVAPAEFDLGWWLMFDRTMHECVGIERLPGEPTRDEQRAFYMECAGRDLGDTHVFEVFGAVRYTAIVVRVMNRAVERGFMPPDHEIWLKNPAAFALADLLGMERA